MSSGDQGMTDDICPFCTATVRDDNYVLLGDEIAHVECWDEYFDDREYA